MSCPSPSRPSQRGPHQERWSAGAVPRAWQRRRGWMFLRFVVTFGFLGIVLFGGLIVLTGIVVRLAGGDRRAAAALWLSLCGLLFFLPLLVGFVGRRAFRRFAVPLSDLMNAAERVAEGDLTVRVPITGHGEFVRLSESFNHMVEELALADRRRRNLTADVAHELRTPLQVIQGNLEGVLDGVYTPTPAHIAATLDETRQLARLVEDLRVLSQAEAGQLTMTWEAVNVAELLADVRMSFDAQAEASQVTLNVECEGAPALLTVSGDYGRLDQVLSNLVANALRHTPACGRVTLRAAPAGEAVRIEVSDTGEGIPAADIPYIFDRFWRGDRSRTHANGPNSGLGLAIARQLVQAHGGQIEVSSEPGRGATFMLTLPRTSPHVALTA